jgi:glycosyltransferase involved in cell wall biosynthesis
MPLVSIVISVYRRATYLREAIQSALQQRFDDIEVIVTEDGRSAEVEAVVNEFAGDARVRFIRNDPPLGAAANKLAAWRSASGQFIVNLDDDDLIDPEFLATLVPPLLENPSATVAFCDHWLIDEHGRRDEPGTNANTQRWGRDVLKPGYLQPFIEAAVVSKAVPMAMGAVFRKSIIDGFQTESGPSYDTFLAYLASRDGQAAWYTPTRLSSWRVHGNQETGHGGIRTAPANRFLAATFEADPRLAAYREIFSRRKYDAQVDYGLNLLRVDRTSEGRHELRKALQQRFSKRAVVGWLLSFAPAPVRKSILCHRWRTG